MMMWLFHHVCIDAFDSVICDPKSMKGLVVFGLLIYLNQEGGETAIQEQKKNKKKPNPHKILER
jgi:hypothetical protein